MANEYTTAEWQRIQAEFDAKGATYGMPKRRKDSVLFASFNIRKLGAKAERSAGTWTFLASICSRFDLIAVQEVMNDLEGFKHLVELMGKDFGFVTSDATGAEPGEKGMEERLAFIFNWKTIKRLDMATDVTFDRTSILDTLFQRRDEFKTALDQHANNLAAYEVQKAEYKAGRAKKPTKPQLGPLPEFLCFIRTPYQVAFQVLPQKKDGTGYNFIAVNAHLNYGDYIEDRWQDFHGLMTWLLAHVQEKYTLYPDCVLLGDLNLDFKNPKKDRPRIEADIKQYDQKSHPDVEVNFPFLDPHQGKTECYRTNARRSETFDQIGLFIKNAPWPSHDRNATMNDQAGPDYGVVDFVSLFANVIEGPGFDPSTPSARRTAFYARFEYEVSDHMPIWMRLPRP